MSIERDGLLDDPSYMAGSSIESKGKNENVFVFSSHVGSMEVLQLIELCTNIGGMGYVGTQRFRYIPGIISRDVESKCDSSCFMKSIEGSGDSNYCLFEPDKILVNRYHTFWDKAKQLLLSVLGIIPKEKLVASS